MPMRVMSGADDCIEPQSSGSCCALDTMKLQASMQLHLACVHQFCGCIDRNALPQ